MVLPKPGTVVVGVMGTPVEVPPGLDREGIERERLRAQAAMDDAHRRAEELLHRPAGAGKTGAP
jgi:hypothetical protein